VSILEGCEVDALVFDAASEWFHEDVVMVAAFAVHADPDTMIFVNACEEGGDRAVVRDRQRIVGA
jgi:hypothetical protein